MNKILLLLTLLNPVFSLFQCPLNSNLQPIDGAFPDPDYCGIYYHCINGTPYPQQCPPGLFFTISLTNCHYETCVEADQADCLEGNFTLATIGNDHIVECSKEDNTINDELTLKDACFVANSDCDGLPNGTYPNKNDCRQYYHCYNGISWPQQCPDGYYFSPSLNVRDCTTKMCVTLEESQCPVAGEWSEWSAWSDCDPSCGNGIRMRTRSCSEPPPMNGGEDCPGNSVDIFICLNQPCHNDTHPAFMVSMITNTFVPRGLYRWQKVNYNNGDLFDASTNALRIKERGFYFLSRTATTSSRAGVYMVGQNDGASAGLFKSGLSPASSISETISASGILQFNQLNRPSIREASTARLIGTENGLETSWTAFQYETNNLFYVSTERTNPLEGSLIVLNNIITMRGVSLNTQQNQLTISTRGWYYINIGAGFASSQKGMVGIVVNDNSTRSENCAGKDISNYRGFNQASRGFIVELDADDEIALKLIYGSIRSANVYTYITGFRLNATSDSPAFHAYSSIDQNPSSRIRISYDTITIDSTSSWSSIDNSYKVSISGLYYIDVSVGIYSRSQSIVDIMVNDEKKLGMRFLSTSHSSYGTLSRTGLLYLQQGDSLSIETANSLYSNEFKLTSLTLFYVSNSS